MIDVANLNHYYGESHTLRDLDLAVAEGGITCLMGRNGVGKTTLLDCVMGLHAPRSGEIRYAGEDLCRLGAEKRARLGIGYVPQGRQIFPLLTVEENLQVGLPARRDKVRQVPGFLFELFPVLETMLGRRGGDLSGGQQQQLAIARALALDPKLLILDEPTEGIQPNIVHEIGDLLRKLNAEHGLTVLVVEQKLPFARRVADRFAIMDRGTVVADGAMADLDDGLVREYLTV
ncbi:MAG: urea ABC transporter ATP-binding subunit UrtE [Gammaproteobacteria bacterium]|nr:urea ABC transporter ATP-binding subunit UrtE [Gammaproteobacteria bacterium]